MDHESDCSRENVILRILFMLGIITHAALTAEPVYPGWLDAPPLNLVLEQNAAIRGWHDTRSGFLAAVSNGTWSKLPLSIELWTAVRQTSTLQVLVAAHPKTSNRHWELFVDEPGRLCAYLPGRTAEPLRSVKVMADQRWHHVALVLTADTATMYLDGAEAARFQGAVSGGPSAEGRLSLGCAGRGQDDIEVVSSASFAELRLSGSARAMSGPPAYGRAATAETLALWRLGSESGLIDLVGQRRLALVPRPPGQPYQFGRVALDVVDLDAYQPGPSPMAGSIQALTLVAAAALPRLGVRSTTLDGTWELAEGGDEAVRLSDAAWSDALPATVPGSVHSALEKAGCIPDPKQGMNDEAARTQSFKTWWFRRAFDRPAADEAEMLVFDGVAISCTVWLNGRRLGNHNGMFGGPRLSLKGLGLQDHNQLVVRLDPAPQAPGFFTGRDNNGWRSTVVFNNSWGWHYSNIPALGIWRSVRIEHHLPVVFSEPPFVVTRNAQAGEITLRLALRGPAAGWGGRLVGVIEADGHKAPVLGFSHAVRSVRADEVVRLSCRIPNSQVWWPNGYGAQPLYRLRVALQPDGGASADLATTCFGIRTLRMAPFPDGPRSDQYNWTFVVNGRPIFMKGGGWCTMDSSMDFSRARYDRFLSAARQQHWTMARAWGSGMPETDDFYDLCDRYGILVMQEWPTAWNSHEAQPYDALEETVRGNTIRLRNHPSLVMWGGGNESDRPFGRAIDMMGRLAQELDGTRPFHRGEPYGGSLHNYDCWWGRQLLDRNLRLSAPFIGEFGIASTPVLESVRRYLPAGERDEWPPREKGSFAYHTPVFNTMEDLARLWQYSGIYSSGTDMASFVRGSQTAQAVALRHALEQSRADWPGACSGILYYKLNDNYPAASWATLDWYGAPKLSHWFVRSAFTPLHAAVLLPALSLRSDIRLPVVLFDDASELRGRAWTVRVRAFAQGLTMIASQKWSGNQAGQVHRLGEFALSSAQLAGSTPLLLVADVIVDGKLHDRSWSFANCTAPDTLYTLPRTSLVLQSGRGEVTIRNTGKLPALGVEVLRPGHADTFTAGDGMLWLDPGESRTVAVDTLDGLRVAAWNLTN